MKLTTTYYIERKQYFDGKGNARKPYYNIFYIKVFLGIIKYRVYIKETECYESGCYKVKIDFETIEEAKYFISNILCTKTARRTTKREIVYIKNCEL